jgi:hypothetical protein
MVLFRRCLLVLALLGLITRGDVDVDDNNAAATTIEDCEIGTDGTCINTVSASNNDYTGSDNDEELRHLLKGMNVTIDDDGVKWIDTGFGVAQQAMQPHEQNISKLLQEVQTYMNDRVLKANSDDVLSKVASDCLLRHELCSFWAIATSGECEANPGSYHLPCQLHFFKTLQMIKIGMLTVLPCLCNQSTSWSLF